MTTFETSLHPLAQVLGTSGPVLHCLTMSEELRARTRDAHLAVESSFPLAAGLSDLQSYGRLLETLRAFYGSVEDNLGAVTGWESLTPAIDVASRRRAVLLDEDLAQLGIGIPLGGPSCRVALPVLDTLAAALGCLYVIEGSSLGGRVIAHRARAALGERLPLAFFTSARREDPRQDWRDLQAAVDSFGADAAGNVRDAVVAGAEHTFVALGAWLVSKEDQI